MRKPEAPWRSWYRTERWKKTSERFRATPEGALCRLCKEQGKITPSQAVDHVVEHRGDPTLFWSPDNWQGICASCHSVKTRYDEHRRKGWRAQIRGCDPSGLPLDPAHSWHKDR